MRAHRLLLLQTLTIAAALLCAAPASAGLFGGRHVVVLPLKNLGVDEDVAASLLGFLRAEVAALPQVEVIDLAKAGGPIGGECKGEAKCLAAAVAKLGADELVLGTVAGVGDSYSIDLKRIAVASGKEEGRVTEQLSGARELLIDGIRGAAYKLLLPEQYVGQIQVELTEQGAEVFLDGKSVGKSPLKEPIGNLTPGKHALKIVKRGFADFDKWIDVRFARVSVVKVDLKNSVITGVMFESGAKPAKLEVRSEPKEEAPAAAVAAAEVPFHRTGTGALVVGGAGAGLLALGGIFALVADGNASVAKKLQEPAGGPVSLANQEAAKAAANAHAWQAATADVLFVAGGAALVGGGVLYLLRLDGSQQPKPANAWLVPTSNGLSLGVSGSF